MNWHNPIIRSLFTSFITIVIYDLCRAGNALMRRHLRSSVVWAIQSAVFVIACALMVIVYLQSEGRL